MSQLVGCDDGGRWSIMKSVPLMPRLLVFRQNTGVLPKCFSSYKSARIVVSLLNLILSPWRLDWGSPEFLPGAPPMD